MNRKEHPEASDRRTEFESQAAERQAGLVRELWDYLSHNKKWWLTPILIVLLLVMGLVLLGPGVAPFIYTLF